MGETLQLSTLLKKILLSYDTISIDTETTGLDPHTSKIILIQIGTPDNEYIIETKDYTFRQLQSFLRPILTSRSITKVFTNTKFDYKMFASNYNIRCENTVDIMVNEMILYTGITTSKGFFSLAGMSDRYVGFKYDNQMDLFRPTITKDIRTSFTTNQPLTPEQIEYARWDVILPLKIYNIQKERLKKHKLTALADLENEYTLVLGDMEYNGFYLDQKAWMKLYQENLIKLESKRVEMHDYLYSLNIDPSLHEDINWNSHQQVVELFKYLGVDTTVIDKEKSTLKNPVYKDSVNKNVLLKQESKFPIIKLYLEYKNLQKATSTYGKSFIEKYVNPTTNRIHSSFHQIKNTGRIGSSKPNIQNIKRGSDYRSCFTHQHPNTTLVVADFSQQELRYAAYISKEPNMIKVYTEGDGDLHTATAKIMYPGKEITKGDPERFHGKTTNFLTMYGGGAHKLADQYDLPILKASKLIRNFWKGYPRLKQFFEEKYKETLSQGYILIDDITNRRSYIDDWDRFKNIERTINYFVSRGWREAIPSNIYEEYMAKRAKIERDSQNYRIQGGCASMSKLAAIYIRQWISKNNAWERVKIVNTIHDEVVLEVRIIVADRALKLLIESMEKAGKVFSPDVPMKAEGMITKFWNH